MAGKKSPHRRAVRSAGDGLEQKRKKRSAAGSIPGRIRKRESTICGQAMERDQAPQLLLLAITRVQALFIDNAQPAVVFGVLLQELLSLTDSAYGFIGEVGWTAEKQPFLQTHAITDIAWNEATKALMAEQAPTLEFRNLNTLFGQVMTTGKPVIANDPANDPRAGGLPHGHPPMHAFLGLPFYRGELLIGMAGIANRPGGYDEAMVAYLEPFLSTCAQLLEGDRNRRLRAEAEDAVRKSEERWQLAVRGSHDGIWDWDLTNNVVYFSPRWKAMLGYGDHEINGEYREWESRLHPEDRERVLSQLAAYLENRTPQYHIEFRLCKKNGEYCWIEARGKAMWDAEGHPYRMAGSHTDITARKQVEQALLEAHLAVELAMEGIAKLDNAGRYLIVNQQYAARLGYRPEELLGQSWEITVHPDDHASVLTKLAWMRETGKAEAEIRGLKRDGDLIYIQVVIVKCTESGKENGHFCFMRDVTERRREDALQAAEKQALELVARGTPLNDVLASICRTVENHTATMRSSVMLVTEDGAHLSAAAGPSLPDEYNRAVNLIPIGPTVGSCGSSAYFGKPSIVADISFNPLWQDYASVALAHGLRDCWSQPILSSAGAVLGTFAAYYGEPRYPQPTDLRIVERASHIAALAIEHARTSEALCESEQRHRSVVAAMAEGVIIQDRDGCIRSCNASACRILGLTEDQIVGRTSFDPRWRAIHEDGSPFPGDTHPAMETLGSGFASENVVMGVHRPDGSLVWISINTQPIMGDEGKRPEGVVASFRDITAQKQREAELKLFRTLLDQVTDSIEVIDPSSGRFLDGNRQSYESLGYTRNELLAMGVPDIDPLVAQPVFQEYMKHLRKADTPLRIESMRLRKDGVTFPVEVVAQIIRHEREYLVAVVRDITERKRLERASQDQHDRLRLAMDIAGVAIWDWNILTNQIIWSDNCKQVKRLPAGSFEGTFDAYQRLVHPEDLPGLQEDIERALSGQKPYHTEHRIVPPTGEVQWLEGNGVVYRDKLGRPIRMVGTVRNITDRKRVERTLMLGEERYARATAVGQVGVWELDVQAGTYYGDKNLKTMFGYQDDELSTDPYAWLNVVFPDDQSVAMTHWQRIVRGEADDYQYELRMVRKDGTVIWTDVRGHAVRDDDGQVTYVIGTTVDITGRKRVETALRESEERFRVIADTVPALIWMSGLDKQCTYFNQRWLNYTGRTVEQELGNGWTEGVHPEDVASCVNLYSEAFDRHEPFEMEYRLRKADGQYGWIHHSGAPRLLSDGTFAGYVGACIDLTDRKRVQENLLRIQFAMDQAVDAVYWIDPRARILYTNEAASAMLGYTADEFLCMTVHDLNPNFPQEVWPEWWAETREKKVVSVETVHVAKDGRRIPIDIRVSFLAYGGQEFHCAFVRDITERKRVDHVLRASQERFELAARATNDGIWDWNILTGEQYWSDRHLHLFGLEPGDCTPTLELWFSLVHPDDVDRIRQATRHHLDTREPYDIEVRVRMKDGRYRWFRDRGQAVWDDTGRPVRMVGSISDITEQRNTEQALRVAHAELEQRVAERTTQLARMNQSLQEEIAERSRAEEAIRESELRYKLLTEATFDGIAIHDQGVLLEVNRGLERMFGYQPGELIGRSILDLIAEESLNLVVANMRDGVRGPYETIARRKDGTTFPGEVVVRPYHYRGKEVRLVAGRDITERKHLETERLRRTEELECQVIERTAKIAKLESQRAQTEKLAAMGRLAAGVAHEINNPIAGIKNAFTLVRQAVDPAHPNAEFAGLIDREIARVASIIQNMYQLCRPKTRSDEMVDVWTLVTDLEALLTPRLQQRRLKFVVDLMSALQWLCVPRGDLMQVLLNLLTNAIECSPEGGMITLSLREEAEGVRLAVCDQGAGIAPEHLPHIFDPFYTTKTGRDQKGMGLGLSVSQSLVQAMGGTIEVDTQVHCGSTFTMRLPRDRVRVKV